ncbi:MAG: hypothetical protein KF778_18505 [Rhodocyclaceae bacterium]|nr:hypothetical protein [Rhodocyclaceae bacterium]MBX3670398.1 hypothetical protein [Rhodocyclaceae bacterium]
MNKIGARARLRGCRPICGLSRVADLQTKSRFHAGFFAEQRRFFMPDAGWRKKT